MAATELFSNIIGESKQIRDLLKRVKKVGASPTATILVRGESGTGKELIARSIHSCSHNAEGPFIELNCAAIPESLLEAELMGYEQGAFTDAKNRKKGLLELAHEGTIFLDEIDALSLNLQAKLLKVIDEKMFRRLGGVEEIKVQVRIIAATNAELEASIDKQQFREDLYYRLNVISIDLPPLRDRQNDVLLIAEHFIARYNSEYGKNVEGFTPGAIALLQSYHWPGNVRELKNVIERAVLLEDKAFLEAEDLSIDRRRRRRVAPSQVQSSVMSPVHNGLDSHPGAPDQLYQPTVATISNGDLHIRIPEEGIAFEDIEKCCLEESLRMTRWNIRRAARLLSLSYDTFRYRMQKYDIS